MTQSSGRRPFPLLLLIGLLAIHCRLVLLLIGSGLFLPLVACLCGGADLEAFSKSRVALAIGLPKSLGNMVVWIRTLGIMDSYSSRITIWDPGGILSTRSLFSCKAVQGDLIHRSQDHDNIYLSIVGNYHWDAMEIFLDFVRS